MGSSSVKLSLPLASTLQFPPSKYPYSLPPPSSEFTYAPAFDIPPSIYNHLLHVGYPIGIAFTYALTVLYVNQVNRQRGGKPWAFSKTSAFFGAVVLHNILLALYSAWTFSGMCAAMSHSWPGWNGPNGVAGAVDALCNMHGPRGPGEAAIYNATTHSWEMTSRNSSLAPSGLPDDTDVGRIWNEGLAFYGWLFYLSKFYEVLDTAVILAKGKKSSALQVYHHTGAMLCMWAGIRYMAPPIWMFVLVNSGIHTLMYTYYTLSSLSISVPQSFKRTLTTMQITQIVVGTTYALAHLFISYSIPVPVPYNAISSFPTTAVKSAVSSIATVVSAGGLGSMLKKLALRAAGEQGLADNVPKGHLHMPNLGRGTFGGRLGSVTEKLREEIRYRTEFQTVPCLQTSGQVFAIALNVLYLLPLTYLFVDFFIRSYSRRTSSSISHSTTSHRIEKSSRDALKGVERELGEEAPTPTEESKKEAKKAAKKAEKKAKELSREAGKLGKQGIEEVKKLGKEVLAEGKEMGREIKAEGQRLRQGGVQDVKRPSKEGKKEGDGVIKVVSG